MPVARPRRRQGPRSSRVHSTIESGPGYPEATPERERIAALRSGAADPRRGASGQQQAGGAAGRRQQQPATRRHDGTWSMLPRIGRVHETLGDSCCNGIACLLHGLSCFSRAPAGVQASAQSSHTTMARESEGSASQRTASPRTFTTHVHNVPGAAGCTPSASALCQNHRVIRMNPTLGISLPRHFSCSAFGCGTVLPVPAWRTCPDAATRAAA
jgi:hypothetical protein